jgi:hypothetical protein
MNVPPENELIEERDIHENQSVRAVKDSLLSTFDNGDRLLNARCIIPVTTVTVPRVTTREHIAQQFTLNNNQKAAFMIITGHLDGLEKINEGKVIKSKSNCFSVSHLSR